MVFTEHYRGKDNGKVSLKFDKEELDYLVIVLDEFINSKDCRYCHPKSIVLANSLKESISNYLTNTK